MNADTDDRRTMRTKTAVACRQSARLCAQSLLLVSSGCRLERTSRLLAHDRRFKLSPLTAHEMHRPFCRLCASILCAHAVGSQRCALARTLKFSAASAFSAFYRLKKITEFAVTRAKKMFPKQAIFDLRAHKNNKSLELQAKLIMRL